ncbi:adenosylcobinamide-phosphate synthase CbiB [Natronobiforma cellulositropha]|uniref:adenosylcobinamide-phosphate synthase CbiB n=1 Tax=Natronobiforma cellulositropha TaxID=1679076 RepID=UPI0021D58099|nr:adenosylcobinamide-phosphate synthase CbiB [Natronobiforma cellulositropha]
MTVLTALAAIALAFSLDLLIGEPPTALHPVAWFGRLVALVDREWIDDERAHSAIGVAVALALPVAAAGVVWWLVAAAGAVSSMAEAVAAAVVLFLTVSLRRLLDLTREVVDASETDLESARERAIGLVGRETDALSPAEIRSAALESAAENLADGLVSTLLPFALLAPISLPLAAAAAVWVKAVNTLDSMLGYHSNPIGAASARLDDRVMWLPARISALTLAVAALDPRALSSARRWARVPASPNSGWPMATLAAALSVRLEKPGAYVLNPDAELPTPDDGTRAIRLVGRAGVLAVALAAALAAAGPGLEAAVVPVLETVVETLTMVVDALVTAVDTLTDVLRAALEWLASLPGRLREAVRW